MNTAPKAPDGFSLAIARDLCGFAATAYEPMTHGAGLGLTIIDDAGTGTRAVIAKYEDHTEIAFRGTVNLRNWLVNLEVAMTGLDANVKVHAGFLKAADALLPQLIQALLPAGADKSALKPIYVTGHSLGGALAALVAWALVRDGLPVVAVYTFASPRVGNAAWRKAYNAELGDKTYRVVAAGDAVPLVPGILAGYRHVGIEIFLDGRIWIQPSRWCEIIADSWRVWWAIHTGDLDFLLDYHSINHDYLPLLTR